MVFSPEDKETLDDVHLSQLMVDDPEAFEQQMIDGQLQGRRDLNEEAWDRGAQSPLQRS